MEKKKKFIINVIFYLLIAGAIWIAGRYLLPVLTPFILAFLAAGVIQIPVRKMAGDSNRKKKFLSIFFTVLLYGALFFFVLGMGAKLVTAAGNLMISFPEIYQSNILPFLNELADKLEMTAASQNAETAEKIDKFFREISQNLGQYISNLSMSAVKVLSAGASGIPGLIVRLVITVVSTFFMAADFDKIIGFAKRFLPESKEDDVRKMIEYIKNIVGIYLKSYILLFLLTFVELSVGLLILRIPYAILVALAVAVFDILPVLGTGGILLPWAVIMAVLGDIPMSVGIIVLYIVITAIRNTVEPRIVGKQIGLHPLAALIAMFIGLKLFGIAGMICLPVGLAVFMNLERNGKDVNPSV